MSDPPDAPKQKLARPLSATARRCLGVLVEKAKTTPDNYPLSLAALITGCNQKSNRTPVMDVDETDALLALDELMAAGAVRLLQGGSRVDKYRHAAYEWWDVDSDGASVMTELFLRGPQTLGELRTRANRMHAFADLAAMQATVDSLVEKELVEPVTPPGRGQVFAHTLYTNPEKLHLAAKVDKITAKSDDPVAAAAAAPPAGQDVTDRLDAMQAQIDALEKRLAFLES